MSGVDKLIRAQNPWYVRLGAILGAEWALIKASPEYQASYALRVVIAAIAGILFLFFIQPAKADVGPTTIEAEYGCVKVKMCDAETNTGVCMRDAGSGDDEIVADLPFNGILTFDSSQSVGAHSCDMYGNMNGYDANSGVGTQINSVALSDSQMSLTYFGMFDNVWVTCSAIGTNVTVVLNACPGR